MKKIITLLSILFTFIFADCATTEENQTPCEIESQNPILKDNIKINIYYPIIKDNNIIKEKELKTFNDNNTTEKI